MSKHVLVLAGTLEQYREWALLADAELHVYVASRTTPMGFEVGGIEEVGTFAGRDDAKELRQAAHRALQATRRRAKARRDAEREAQAGEEGVEGDSRSAPAGS